MFWRQKICIAFVSDKASNKAFGTDKDTFEKSRQVEMKTVSGIVPSKVYVRKKTDKRK